LENKPRNNLTVVISGAAITIWHFKTGFLFYYTLYFGTRSYVNSMVSH